MILRERAAKSIAFASSSAAVERRRFRAQLLSCWLLLLVASFARFSLPAVNEPHYLGKALHFWDPSYCPDDLFMTSANPHAVFYAAVGWIAASGGLWWAAVIGRAAALACVAAGWVTWVSRLSPGHLLAAPASLLLFTFLHSVENLAGEWVVGGVEAKVFAYGALFAAAGFASSGQLRRASALAGVGTALHPVVGAWSVISGGLALVVPRLLSRDRDWPKPKKVVEGAICAGLFLLLASPGLIPALLLLTDPVGPELRHAAALVLVRDRLKHHLDPMEIGRQAWLVYAVLAWAGFALARRHRVSPAWRWSMRLVAFSLCGVAIGVLLGLRSGPLEEMPGLHWRVELLTLYWFRLADTLVPLLLSIAAVHTVLTAARSTTPLGRRVAAIGCASIAVGMLVLWPGNGGNPMRRSPEDAAAFEEMSGWIQANTPSDAVFVTSREIRGFKWFAKRSEYVSRKDVPQDAGPLLEWAARSRRVAAWRQKGMTAHGYTRAMLADLYEETGADYILENRPLTYPVAPLFEVGRYRLFASKSSAEAVAGRPEKFRWPAFP